MLDTSVLLRLFHDHEDDLQPAGDALSRAVADGFLALVLLDLSIYEFVNILIRRLGKPVDEALGDVDALFALGAPVYAVDLALSRAVTRIAWETGLSGYDAAFVGAARILGVPLITADLRIADATGGYDVLTLGKLRV